jgi:cytochrome c
MKTPWKLAALFLPFFVLLVVYPFQDTIAQQAVLSPTPTYDPLAEPPLPEHPTEYELGRNLYWHWCMTCHGDVGRGRGCHAGHPGDMGFPIPTVVPALVSASHLVQFASIQGLSDFLKATHPPQSPGILKDEEYHAIALFVFTMNHRPLIDFIPTATASSTLTASPTSMPTKEIPSERPSFRIAAMIVFVLFLIVVVFLWGRRMFLEK